MRLVRCQYARIGIRREGLRKGARLRNSQALSCCAQQYGVVVRYDGVIVGEYTTDLLVEDTVLVELKAVKALDDIHLAQCLNYLKATDLRLCLLLNFGQPRLQIKRVVRGF